MEVDLREAEGVRIPAAGIQMIDPIWLDYLVVVIKRKFLILSMVGGLTILALVIAMVMTPVYTASTTMLPPRQEGESIPNPTSALGQLGALAALAGPGIGLKNPNDLYVAMLHSHAIQDELIKKFDLLHVYHATFLADAERHLDRDTEIRLNKDGTIVISVTDRSPQRAADLANAYVDQLSELTKTLAVTEAAKRKVFFEGEMNNASEELSKAELALKETQEKTGLYLLDSQSRAMIQSLATLRAQISAKEADLQVMHSFASPDNPDLQRAEQELAALQAQEAKLETGQGGSLAVEKVPAAGLEYLRKYRDVKYRQILYELLARQYEMARVDEGRDPVLIQQLDQAVRPVRKSGPHRSWIVIAMFLLACLLSLFTAFALEHFEHSKEDPNFQTRLQLLRFYLKRRPWS